jgi:hypothetical protein
MRLTRNRATIGVLAGAAALAAAVAPATPAQAQAEDTTDVTVAVAQVITLTDLTPAVDLAGEPGETVTVTDAVSMTVTTNNAGGYSVTVVPTTTDLTGATTGDTIPFTDVEVENSDGAFTPLDPGAPVTVHTQTTPSAAGGDTVTHDYQIDIPFVDADTYTGTVVYVATANL